MHCRDPEQLGDEPLYCEADHDSVLFSGSENDYYEAPETRRLRIEAKAVQFLNGNVPYLLSARLEGPFDRQSWTNPWRSKRRERQVNSGRTSGQRTVKTLEAARGDVIDKAPDDPPDTQKTNLYPLPSPETTNPPSARKNPYLDESEYNWIKEWRDTAEGSPTAEDPFCASRYNAISDASSTKKRPANEEWLHREEPKKRKSMQVMTSPAQSLSRAPAQKRSKKIRRHSSVAMKSAPRSSPYRDDVSVPRDATISSLFASGASKEPKATPYLSKTGSLLNGKRIFNEKSESSEDELSMSSTTPSGRTARLPARKLSSPDYSPSRHSKQTKQAKMFISQDVEEETDDGISEPVKVSQLVEYRSNHLQEALKHMKISRNRAIGQSQQDSSFCFHHTKVKSPAKEARRLYANQDDPNEPAAGFSSSQQIGTAVIAELDIHKRYNAHPAGELGQNDTPDLDRMTDAAHELAQNPHDFGNYWCVLGHNDDRKERESENVHRQEPKANAVSTHSECEATKPEQLPKEIETTNQSSPKADADTLNADWSTYINTQDLSVVSAESLQEKQSQSEIGFLVQGDDDESDSDWATVTTTQDVLMSDPTTGEPAGANGYPLVVEQGLGDRSDPEWSTFLDAPDRSATSRYQFESSALRRGSIDGLIEYASESDWSTCMSVSQSDVDQTVNTSNESSSVDMTAPEAAPLQDIPASATVAHPQNHEAGLGSQHVSPTGISPSIVAGTMTVEENTELVDVPPAKINETGSSALMENSTSDVEQEIDECAKASQNLERSATGTGLATPTTADESRTENRTSPKDEMVIDSKTPRGVMNTLSTADSIIVDTTANNTKSQQLQSPWSEDSAIDALRGAVPVDDIIVTNERQTGSEVPQEQSPWSKEHMETPLQNVQTTQYDKAIGDGRSPELSLLAERALAFASTPCTPWMADKLPSPDFSLSVKRFSDFMKPSPTKKRFSPNQSSLRSPSFGSNILFKTSTLPRPQRRVTFAPLPGEEVSGRADYSTQDDGSVYVEQDVSCLDPEGKKTTTVRVTRPPTRPASPPPRDINSAEAGRIPDHDHKFAKHFEAMSKRKNNPRQRAPRLLPLGSPQTNSSQEVGAMAEAFIQASQMRRKGLELDAASIDSPVRAIPEGRTADGQATPLHATDVEEQENTAPVDDVSAVLDNLNDFLDNTWGINLGMDDDQDAEPGVQHIVQTASSQSLKSALNNNGDPMWGVDVNVWAD